MNSLSDVVKIIKELEGVSSTKGKEHILRINSDNEILKKVLYYTYSDMQYGIKKTTVKKMDFLPDEEYMWINIWKMFEDLSNSNINNDLVKKVSNTIGFFNDKEQQDLLIRMLLKDLRIGMNVKSINKAIPNLIPTFEVMKASSYDEKNSIIFNKKAKKEGYMMMIKYNGIRGEIIKQDDKITVKSRQNKIVEGFYELNEAFKNMPNGYLYEGEILAVGDFKTSKEQFKETDKIYSTKGKKVGLMIRLFDLIPINDFNKGVWEEKAKDRKDMLKKMIEKNNNPLVQFADIIYEGKDTDIIQSKLEGVSKDGVNEGLMVMLNNGIYESKRVKQILKCKLWQTADLEVIGLKESNENPNTLGSLILDFNGREQGCAGISDELKQLWWDNPKLIIGKIIECKYKEITEDKNGNKALQFCTFIRVRNDKDKKDINVG